jgi:hypothetical protein
LGALSFRHSVARIEPPMPLSPNEAAWVGASRGCISDQPWRDVMGDTPSALRSSDVAVLGDKELELSRFPQAPLLPTEWRQVMGGGAWSWHARKS